jgi:hypothetical protein
MYLVTYVCVCACVCECCWLAEVQLHVRMAAVQGIAMGWGVRIQGNFLFLRGGFACLSFV